MAGSRGQLQSGRQCVIGPPRGRGPDRLAAWLFKAPSSQAWFVVPLRALDSAPPPSHVGSVWLLSGLSCWGQASFLAGLSIPAPWQLVILECKSVPLVCLVRDALVRVGLAGISFTGVVV